MMDILQRVEIEDIDAALRPVSCILDRNPEQLAADYARTFGQEALLLRLGPEERTGMHSIRHRYYDRTCEHATTCDTTCLAGDFPGADPQGQGTAPQRTMGPFVQRQGPHRLDEGGQRELDCGGRRHPRQGRERKVRLSHDREGLQGLLALAAL